MIKRCDWANQSENERVYHDTEWGRPQVDETLLFELLVLEIMQAGLSWRTILDKRQNFKEAFDYFDYEKISQYDDKKRQELRDNKGIVRNRLKIDAVINNAGCFMEIQRKVGSFKQYIWAYVNGETIYHQNHTMADVPTQTELSKRISKELKAYGFKFIGPTIIYSYMQSIGIINDHLVSCSFR